MRCNECEHFKENMCVLANEGRISELEDVTCLLRLQIMLLRDIWDELSDDIDEADEWKFQ